VSDARDEKQAYYKSNQKGIATMERASALREFANGHDVIYCPGPGWPPKKIRDIESFDHYQSLSLRGVKYARGA